MGIQTPNPGGQPKQTPPQPPTDGNSGKGIDQDGEEGQEIPKTGRDPSEPIEQQVSNDTQSEDDDDATDDDASDDDASDDDEDDDDADDDDEDLTGTIELPGEGGAGEGDRRDGSTPAGNP